VGTPAPKVLDEVPPDPGAWQRERERRERAQAGAGQPLARGDDPWSGD
jgi:hypothetical protein